MSRLEESELAHRRALLQLARLVALVCNDGAVGTTARQDIADCFVELGLDDDAAFDELYGRRGGAS